MVDSPEPTLPAIDEKLERADASARVAVAAPVAASERIQSIDVLRGFALLGILVMNIQAFAMPMAAYVNPTAYGDLEGINLWVWRLSHLFADMKFMSIFSMLFGAGIILMTSRNEAKGRPSGLIHYKRMFLLLLFGMLHAYAFWWGDILFLYAICGFWLYLLRRWWPVFQFMSGAALIPIVTIFMLGGWWWFGVVEREIPHLEEQITASLVAAAVNPDADAAINDPALIPPGEDESPSDASLAGADNSTQEEEIPDSAGNSDESKEIQSSVLTPETVIGEYGQSLAQFREQWDANLSEWSPSEEEKAEEIAALTGSYWEEFKYRFPRAIGIEVMMVFFFMWRVAGMMLMGMALFRWGVFSAKKSVRFYTVMLVLGMTLGLPLIWWGIALNEAAGFPMVDGMFLYSTLNYYGSIFVAFGWVGLVMLICKTGVLRGLTRRLAAVGQMALTNYFLHTIICTTIFYGRSGAGLGYFGEFERWQQALLLLGIWIFQLIVSPIWLRHFRFGPFEWLWRSLTYLKLQPMRRLVAGSPVG